ncbi:MULTISPECIES: hypothetical protein [unclassified Kitasatospora]|uniref:hypothetical protein n=1 Tax=unclassified Kitasatospora TaxID=2633591 RepID=UPI000AC1B59B|nr:MULTISPECIES: hypothetical protein [unclassified Kitasatospora]
MTREEKLPAGSVDDTVAEPEESRQATEERDEQAYFEQLAAVKDSILEGVITPW